MTEILTVRVPDELAAAIDREYSEYGYGSKAEYIRAILRDRPASDPNTVPNTTASEANTDTAPGANTGVDELRERVAALEDRVDDLASAGAGEHATSASDAGVTRSDPSPTVEPEPEHAPSDAAHDDGDDHLMDPVDSTTNRMDPADVPADVDAAIDGLDLPPPQEGTLQDRKDALRAAWERLREHGEAERSDLTDLYDRYPAGYGSPNTWYERLVSTYLRELPGVEHTGSTRQPWQWTGEPGG